MRRGRRLFPLAAGPTHFSQPIDVKMKSLWALTIFTLIGAGAMLLPGTAPTLQARQPIALAKADRLPIERDCSKQAWPNLDASCLHSARGAIGKVRIVNARH